jgi:hypothetical protein
MSRRIIPVLCALAVAVVPATALAQPAQDPAPPVNSSGVVHGDTKYDLQNQQDQKAPTGVSTYEKAISGDTKGNLPRAVVPGPAVSTTPVTPAKPTSQPTASTDDGTNGWQIAAIAEAAVLAALAIGAFAFVANRQQRAPRMGV